MGSGKNATPIQKTSGPESNTVHPDSRITELKKWVQHALARKLEAQQAEFEEILAKELRYVRQDIEKERQYFKTAELLQQAQIVALQAKIGELETDAIASTAQLYLWRNEVQNLRSQLPPVPLCTPAEVEPVAPPYTPAEVEPVAPPYTPAEVEPADVEPAVSSCISAEHAPIRPPCAFPEPPPEVSSCTFQEVSPSCPFADSDNYRTVDLIPSSTHANPPKR